MAQLVAISLALLVCFSLAHATSDQKDSHESRIVGGANSYRSFVVSIQENDHLCTGVILSDRWVLTAASCVIGQSPYIAKVRYASQKTSYGGQIARIYRIIPHPNFNSIRAENDIALIETERLTGGYSTAFLTTNHLISNLELTVYGWGSGFESNGQASIQQQSVQMPGSNANYMSDCRTSYASQNITLNSVTTKLCVGDIERGGKGVCHGDAGSPALSGSTLYGIASFSYGCGKAGFPGIFTAVGYYRDWIRQTASI